MSDLWELKWPDGQIAYIGAQLANVFRGYAVWPKLEPLGFSLTKHEAVEGEPVPVEDDEWDAEYERTFSPDGEGRFALTPKERYEVGRIFDERLEAYWRNANEQYYKSFDIDRNSHAFLRETKYQEILKRMPPGPHGFVLPDSGVERPQARTDSED